MCLCTPPPPPKTMSSPALIQNQGLIVFKELIPRRLFEAGAYTNPGAKTREYGSHHFNYSYNFSALFKSTMHLKIHTLYKLCFKKYKAIIKGDKRKCYFNSVFSI